MRLEFGFKEFIVFSVIFGFVGACGKDIYNGFKRWISSWIRIIKAWRRAN